MNSNRLGLGVGMEYFQDERPWQMKGWRWDEPMVSAVVENKIVLMSWSWIISQNVAYYHLIKNL